MDDVGELVGAADRSEATASQQDDKNLVKVELSGADNATPNVSDAKPTHVSFFLDGDKVDNGLLASSDIPPPASPAIEMTSSIASEEAMKPSAESASSSQNSLENLDEKGITELADLMQDEQTDSANVDTEAIVELQQSRSLPEAINFLSRTTQELEGRVNVLLAQHEEEFFAAFRSHMAKVQKHVESLQACADEQKNLLERDLRIKTLQQELQWFVNEAVRLDQEPTESQGTGVPAPKAIAPPALVAKAAFTVHTNPPYQLDPKTLKHKSSEDPEVMKETIEDLRKQVSCLAATNRRLQNEAKRNSRVE
ncbi:myosin heavy chain, putative [Eimeria brunetti]|uniref:Myosin heavy chain, putative n=1 Tax=Eimeria brunetti TaxID=51314 RepID=U6LSB5_9EIME|nr:myosin heavy chain, putative [Eimeria brunetti]